MKNIKIGNVARMMIDIAHVEMFIIRSYLQMNVNGRRSFSTLIM